jgi:hypothetical protein
MQFNDDYFANLAVDPQVVALVDQAADRVMAGAKAGAPEDSGDYKAGIRKRRVRRKQIRTVVIVEATDPKSMLIESKTGNLARALRRAKSGR